MCGLWRMCPSLFNRCIDAIKKVGQVVPDKKVDSVCPYCGVGCLLTYNIKDDKNTLAEGRDGPANMSRLCVKGRYGFNYVNVINVNSSTCQKERSF